MVANVDGLRVRLISHTNPSKMSFLGLRSFAECLRPFPCWHPTISANPLHWCHIISFWRESWITSYHSSTIQVTPESYLLTSRNLTTKDCLGGVLRTTTRSNQPVLVVSSLRFRGGRVPPIGVTQTFRQKIINTSYPFKTLWLCSMEGCFKTSIHPIFQLVVTGHGYHASHFPEPKLF